MLKNTTPNKKVHDTKDEDANPSDQTTNREPANTSETKAAHAGLPTVPKRSCDNVQDNGGPNKKFKTDDKDKQLIDQNFGQCIGNIRYQAMTRRELEDLVVRKVIEEEKAKCEFAHVRKQLVKTQIKLAIYRRKIAEVSNHFHGLDSMERQNSHGIAPVGTTQAAGQKAAVLVKCQAHAADSMLPPSSGIPPKVAPSNRPITDKQARKWTNKGFAVKAEPTKAPIMENDRLGQAANIALKKTGQSGGRRASI